MWMFLAYLLVALQLVILLLGVTLGISGGIPIPLAF